jgi:subtilisin-like proprotein convertase family protein
LKGSNGGDSADDVIGNFPGTLALFESLEPFNGLDALGDWTLTATDAFPSADDGVVNSWSANVACE